MHVRIVANSRIAYRPLAAIVVVSVVVLTLLYVDLSSRDLSSRGEWRRTAHGWERSGAWLVATSGPPASIFRLSLASAAPPRFDTHPITLAFVQLIGTMLALFAAIPRGSGPQHGGMLAAISRSFRASVFGS